jgi:predicted nucleic acid-binding protein
MAAIYLDTCMIIGLIEGDTNQKTILKSLLPLHQIYSTELARLEARLLAVRQNNETALQQFDRFFTVCEMIDLNRAVFELATTLRAESQLKTPDALHLAAAIQSGCSEFWTNDKQLVKAAGKRLMVVDWAMLENWTT